MNTPRRDDLRDQLERQSGRHQRAERERGGLLRHSVFLGTVAGLLILPIVAGAYLGLWLDERTGGYSFLWTPGLIVLGIGVGVFNVVRYVRERL